MSEKSAHVRKAPRWALISALGLIALTVASALVSRQEAAAPAPGAEKAPVESARLIFEDGDKGTVVVRHAGSGTVIATLQPGTNGFVRTVVRSLAFQRRRNGHGRAEPFTLARWPGGGFTIADPLTGRRVDLLAFGVPNAQSFARLLTAAVKVRRQDAQTRTDTVPQ